MPEGPEVTFLTEFIKGSLQSNTLTSISFLKGRYVNHGPPQGYLSFAKELPMRCICVQNKGKVIFMYFQKGWCIVSKLGMSGWWYEKGGEPTWKSVYPNIVFHIRRRTLPSHDLLYSDFRNFGTLAFLKTDETIRKELDNIAPDIVAPTTDWRIFKQRLSSISPSKAQWLIEDALIDQKLLVSGIGNYLKSEVLYGARISPHRKLAEVSKDEWRNLFDMMKKTVLRMSNALKRKAETAYFDAMMVYMKKTDPFGNTISVTYSKHGRATYWVPRLQI